MVEVLKSINKFGGVYVNILIQTPAEMTAKCCHSFNQVNTFAGFKRLN